jgi:hypothetical protein
MRTTLITLLCLGIQTAWSTDYYVSTTDGQPTNSGLSASSPKQTFAQAKSLPNFGQAGDRIFFKRGDVFRETVRADMTGGTQASPIQMLAYGPGTAFPVISGANDYSGGWQVHAGSGNTTIWKKTVGTANRITQLYLDGKRMTPARWPNAGLWARTTSSHPWGCSFSSTTPFTGGGDFNGATLRARTTNSSYEIRTINQSNPGAGTIGNPGNGGSLTNPYATFPFSHNQNDIYGEPWRTNTPGYAFYVDNKLNLLDAVNEWFYDASAGVLYLMTGDASAPNARLVEGFVRDATIELPWGDTKWITFDGFEVRHSKRYGVYTGNNANNRGFVFRNCYIHDHEGNSVQNNSTSNFLLETSRIENGYWSAVQVGTGAARNNTFKRNCMIEGYGEDWFGYTALEGGLEAQNNTIDSSGYIGMGISTNGLARQNLITNSCLILNDGAAFAIPFGSRDMLIENNVIINVQGNVFTNGPRDQLVIGKGMYFGGNNNQNITFRNNTIINTPGGAGIGMLDSYNSTVTGNLVYGAANGLMHYNTGGNPNAQAAFGHTITGNTFISDQPNTYSFLIRSDHGYTDNLGTINNNYYWQPYSNVVAKLNFRPSGFEDRFYSLDSWRGVFGGRDSNTKKTDLRLSGYRVTSTGPELLVNGLFTSDVSGWSGVNGPVLWDNGSTAPASLLAGGGVLRANIGTNDLNIKASPFSINTPGKRYQLQFKHVTTAGAYFEGRMNLEKGNSYQYLGLGDAFVAEPVMNRENRVFVNGNGTQTYPLSDATLKLLFYPSGGGANKSFWADSLSLREVTAGAPDPLTNYIRVFVNTTTTAKTYALAADTLWKDFDGNTLTGSFVLQPFTSRALAKTLKPAAPPVAGSGTIIHEYWLNVPGDMIGQFSVNQPVSGTAVLTALEGPSYWADNYGARIRGYVIPSTSGAYRFYLAGDNEVELYLSTTEFPANKSLIASMYGGWTFPREWTKYPSQQSGVVNLVAGQKYYVEILHKEGTGGDAVAVGWTGPGSTSISVVGGNNIAPYVVPVPPIVTGQIIREYWTNMGGNTVTQIPVNQLVSGTAILTSLEGPTNWADNYGDRIRGYVIPTTTGGYTFYLAGDDNCELYLGTNDSPTSKSLIGSIGDWTMPREWTKYGSQKSGVINLVAGQKYYVEILHKEGGGGDNVAVGWTGPGISTITVIGGVNISPYQTSGGPRLATESFSTESGIRVYPNPVGDELTLSGLAEPSQVDIMSQDGRVIRRHEGVQNQSQLRVSELPKGLYILRVFNDSQGVTTHKILKL